jgi:hypothetical protein
VNLQLLFIADLKQKKIDEEGGGREKPGRQIVTFLIFCNLGLWITYNFEIQKVSHWLRIVKKLRGNEMSSFLHRIVQQ